MKYRRLNKPASVVAKLSVAGVLVAGMALGMSSSAQADSIVPTPLRPATDQDMVGPAYPTDYIWVAIQDPHSKAKILATTLPADSLLPPLPFIGYNVTEPNGHYRNLLNLGTGGPLTTTGTPSVTNQNFDFRKIGPTTWKEHINDQGLQVDVTFTGAHPGGAMQPIDWDGQQVYWSSSVGTADVNGWVTYPDGTRYQIKHWAGEEERMAGNFVLGPGHKGYDYAQSGNPDGSADQLFGYPGLDGSFRGILSHTTKDGKLTYCADPKLENSNWDKRQIIAFPRTVHAFCTSPTPLQITYYVTDPHVLPLSATNFGWNPGGDPYGQAQAGLGDWAGLGSTSMSGGHSNVPGSVATVQHLRDHPFTGRQDPFKFGGF